MRTSPLIWTFPLLFVLSGFIAGGELVWAQALVACVVYPSLFYSLGVQATSRSVSFPKVTFYQKLFLSALFLLAVLAEVQGNTLIGWAPLKQDALRYSASTWLLLAYSVLCICLVRQRETAAWVMGSLAFVAILQVMFGVIVLSSGVDGYYLRGEFNIYTNLQGGFFNKNSFAAFLNLTIFCTLGLYVRKLTQSTPVPGEGWRRFFRLVSDVITSASTRLFLLLVLFTVALIASYSRAGIGLFFIGAVVFFGLCMLYLNRVANHVAFKLRLFLWLFVIGIAGIFVVYLLTVKIAESAQLDRINQLAIEAAGQSVGSAQPPPSDKENSSNTKSGSSLFSPSRYQDTVMGRIEPAFDSLSAIKEKYIFGVGAANFQWVFTAHRTETSADGYYKYAHSDAIQFLIESGIVGLILYAVVFFAPLIAAVGLLRDPSRSTGTKCLVLGCISGVIVVFLHSFIDFPFQIFGVVLPVITLLNLIMIMAAPIQD